jgi:hypothetical protein
MKIGTDTKMPYIALSSFYSAQDAQGMPDMIIQSINCFTIFSSAAIALGYGGPLYALPAFASAMLKLRMLAP